jgi:uncharacterized protein YvpB
MICPNCSTSILHTNFGNVCLRCESFVQAIPPSRSRRKLTAMSVGIFCFVLAVFFIASYLHAPLKLQYSLSQIRVTSSIKVTFSKEVAVNKLHYSLTPSANGSWKIHHDLLGATAVEFVPAHQLTPGSAYNLKLAGLNTIDSKSIPEQSINITTESPADFAGTSPSKGAVNVPVDTSISITLKAPNHGLRKLQAIADGSVNLQPLPNTSDDQTFTWHFGARLPQGQTVNVIFLDLNQNDPAKRQLASLNFTTVKEPTVTAATQTNHLYPNIPINISFDQPMSQSHPALKFNLPGTGKWISPIEYQFNPGSLTPGTSYSYTLLKGAASEAGGLVEKDDTFTISTPGAAYLQSYSPSRNNIALNTSIWVTFDQPVDHSTAQSAFTTSPTLGGSFSWSGNSMEFKPAGLEYQKTYTASLRSGIKSLYGLPSGKSFSFSFTTAYQVIKLPVPYFRQAYSLSCEEASLRMALAYRGINVSDFDVLQRVGYSPRPRDTSTNSWDNPYEMYVGDVNGIMGSTGWGVYSPRIAAAAKSFGRSSQAITGISVGQISSAIHSGNPVVLWGFSGSSPKMDSWNTSSGLILAARNEHVRTIVGVVGNITNPVGFYINDPIFGQFYWTTSQLINNMNYAGQLGSQGVIVF